MKLTMVGCGRLGLPCAELLSEYYDITGFDPAGKTSERFNILDDLEASSHNSDIIFIAVPTPHEPGYGGETPSTHLPVKDFDYSILHSVLHELNELHSQKKLLEKQRVVVISTVLPSTIRGLSEQFGELMIIYNPYLIAIGTVKQDMLDPDITIIGTETGASTAFSDDLLEVYRGAGVLTKKQTIGTWEEAEAIKIFYNTFISWKITFANMVQDVAEGIGHMNVDVVTDALSLCSKRILSPKYMTAGMGDGGACHPRDNIALSFLSEKLELGYDLFGEISLAREQQAKNLASRLVDLSKEYGLPIVICGKSYKPHTSFIDGSYSLLIEAFIRNAGHDVEFIDKNTGDYRTSEGPAVFLLAHNSVVTYGVSKTDTSDFQVPENSVVVDPWRRFYQQGVTTILYGDTRSS